MTPIVAATALLAGSVLLSVPALAEMAVCNKTKTSASVAVGYLDGAKGWMAQGWWQVAGGDCQTLIQGPLAGNYIYLLVDGGRLPPGKKQPGGWFCTDNDGFATRNDDYSNDQHELLCEAAGLKTEQFSEIKIGGKKDVTYNLTK
jgi:uncharacterized membrane protein